MKIPIIEIDPKIKEVYMSTWDKDSTDFLVYQNETAYLTECPTRIKPVEGNAIMKFITEAGEHFILSVFEGSMAYAVSGKGFNKPVLGGEWEKVFEAGRGRIQVRYPDLKEALKVSKPEEIPFQITQARGDGAIRIAPHRTAFFENADPEQRNKNKLTLYLRGLLSGKLWCYSSQSESDMVELSEQLNRLIEADLRFELDDVSAIMVLRSPYETA